MRGAALSLPAHMRWRVARPGARVYMACLRLAIAGQTAASHILGGLPIGDGAFGCLAVQGATFGQHDQLVRVLAKAVTNTTPQAVRH